MFSSLIVAMTLAAPALPIALHPDNPHYFLFRARPTVLLTSAEHYGSVLNLDFDFIPYVKELKARRFNYTRIFSGAYCEDPKSFNIRDNTLAPAPERFLCPWARSSSPGYANGGNRFDLTRWDDAYFRRLKTFCAEAGRRGIVVELSLFCPFYEESMWNLSPMNSRNNVNGVGECRREEVYALQKPDLTAIQDALVVKLAEELKAVDNLIFEICNEPYFGGVTLAWQRHIAGTLADAEKRLGVRHLIAQNIANGSGHVADPDPNVSIFNFHYAAPPDAVIQNFDLNRAIGCDETGFRGVNDLPYRTEGWDFLMAGGSLYNNLDYSYTIKSPEGSAPVAPPTPGGGGAELRRQMGTLQRFFSTMDFVKLRPSNETVISGVPAGATCRVLAEAGKVYALYLKGGKSAALTLDLPVGSYRVEWLHPKSGASEPASTLRHQGGHAVVNVPEHEEDIALRLTAR